MGAKRALIVDDSKSARLFLARILEKYEIDVDSAESAEAAIEYLASHRPDVIFMDHMMPGMDGFQAVQAIKNDPRTATIPIMMYTSQAGELYLSQARALGAVGVLPKQIKQADVSKVLYQLHLVPDRRTFEQSTFKAVNMPAGGSQLPLEDQIRSVGEITGSKPLTETALREHFADLRRALVAGIDTQTDRITTDIRALLMETLPPPLPGSRRQPAPWGWFVASVALLIAILSTALWWHTANQLNAATVELEQLRRALSTEVPAAPPGSPAAGEPAASTPSNGPAAQTVGGDQVTPAPRRNAAGAGSADAARPAAQASPGRGAARQGVPSESKPLVVSVPYGADALGGSRLETIRQLLYRLLKDGVSGVVELKTYPGRFCLMGNTIDGFSLAPDETPYAKCDVVGNPADEALSPAQRTPLALANLIGEIRSSSHGTLDVQSSSGDSGMTLVPYPPVSSDLTAGEWNRAGSANNRLEIRVR